MDETSDTNEGLYLPPASVGISAEQEIRMAALDMAVKLTLGSIAVDLLAGYVRPDEATLRLAARYAEYITNGKQPA